MPKPRALRPDEARRTLANRFAGTKDRPGLADRLRQLATRFGLRSKRVFLVWTKALGEERGVDDEVILARVELLPTPKIVDLTSVTPNPFSAGKYPVGSIRVEKVSLTFTFDELAGKKVPGKRKRVIPEDVDFFYEVVEDGRGDEQPIHQRYRLLSLPDRREGRISWSMVLERAAEDLDRKGKPQQDIDPDLE